MTPLSWSGRSADIGALRTHCIGCWTSPSAKMTAACATGRRRATSPSFVRSLSTWSPETKAPKPASVAGARRLPGTTPTCSRSSHAKLVREPWAVHVNRVLQDLRGNRLIRLAGGRLTVLDWGGLRAASDFDPTYLHLEQEQEQAA